MISTIDTCDNAERAELLAATSAMIADIVHLQGAEFLLVTTLKLLPDSSAEAVLSK